MKVKLARKHLSAAIAASLALDAMPALADQLEEVIVTARKRDESIMQVPTTAAVLSRQSLEDYAVGDVKGIANKVPGLNFSSGPTASGLMVSLRGVGSGSNNPGIDQSVALVADGMQLTQGLAFQAATFDLAQVEVLKGPQALFFGKAAPAGVISVKSADPSEVFEASLRGGYEFEAQEQLGELIVSGPATQTLGLRLAAQFSDMQGYFENEAVPANHPVYGDLGAAPVTEKDFPNSERVLLRGTAVWNPTDRLGARLKLNYSDMETQGYGGEPQFVSCPDGSNSILHGLGIDFIAGDDCKADDKQNFVYMDPAAIPGVYNGGVPFSQAEQYFGTLELNYDLGGDLSLTALTGYYEVEQKSMFNGSLTTDFGPPFAIGAAMDRRDFTQELRLTSNYDGALNFMIGGFYQNTATDLLGNLPANQTYAAISSRFRLPPALALADNDVDGETLSAFGQVLWQLTPELELGVGARWTGEDREHRLMNRIPELSGGSAVPVPLANPDLGSSNWSPELSLTYMVTDNLTLFGNLKQAYKSGSFDTTSVKPGQDSSFEDERVRGGEVGLKSRGLDDTLAVNVSGYYYNYDDLQLETRVFDPLNGIVGVRTTNAAAAEIYGVDLDASYAPPAVDGLTLFAAVNYNKAEYDDFANAQCWNGQTISQGCNRNLNPVTGAYTAQDLSGDPLLRAPEWAANFGFDYERPVFGDMTLRFGSNTRYSDSYSASSTNYADAYQDSYVKTSASVGLVGPEERWQVEFIGDNLTDEITFGNCSVDGWQNTVLMGTDQGLSGTGTAKGGVQGQPETACFTERGRSAWLRLTVKLY